jgi:hypothetical protein
MGCPPRMAGCRVGCLHRRLVTEYHAARQADWEAAEHSTRGYATELREYRAQRPALTFQQWLVGQRDNQWSQTLDQLSPIP